MHGGARRGAGRKPSGPRALVSHARRPSVVARRPVLVTCKRAVGLPSLRAPAARDVIYSAMRLCERQGLRLVHFSIQADHVHAIVEATDARMPSRGMQGLSIRVARGLNRLWRHGGRVLADRYHARELRTPREVRNALAYVINNARKHGHAVVGIDPYSSGAAFDGWERAPAVHALSRSHAPPPVVPARSWLLTIGWRRHGRIRLTEVPGRR
jgi:REP element-mobilizing transposase RayT